jgi:hypothetical protein
VKRVPRRNFVMATCYFVYTFAALAILIMVLAVNSQGSSDSTLISSVFAIVLISPVPMLLVGAMFLRGSRWAPACAVALAVFHVVTLATQVHLAREGYVGDLPWPRAELHYFGSAQTYYLPGSLVLAVVSLLALRRRSEQHADLA